MPRQSTAQPGLASSVPTSPFQPLPLPIPSSLASSQGCSKRGSPPGLWSSCHWEQAQILVEPRKSPRSTGRQVPQKSRNRPCSEQREFPGAEERLATNCLLCQETLDLGPSISRDKHSCVCLDEGPHPSDCSSAPSWVGVGSCAALSSVCWWEALSSPASRAGLETSDVLFRWLERGTLSLTSPSLCVHTQLF